MAAQTYSVLRSGAEDNTELRVVEGGFKTRGAALSEAKKLNEAAKKLHGSWADRFCVALLEEV